jgi:hypothetical protein
MCLREFYRELRIRGICELATLRGWRESQRYWEQGKSGVAVAKCWVEMWLSWRTASEGGPYRYIKEFSIVMLD